MIDKFNTPDPKLKAAMEEIKPILAKYDVAALVALVGPKHMEYLWKLDPSWSCVSVDQVDDNLVVRMKANNQLYPNPKEKKAVVERSVGIFFGLRDMLMHRLTDALHLVRTIEQALPNADIKHTSEEIE